MMKKCSDCKLEKSFSEFSPHKRGKDGYRADCKECRNARNKKWRIENPEKHKAYRKAYYEANKVQHAAKMKAYNQENKEKVRAKNKAWIDNNRERHRKYQREAQKARYWRLKNAKLETKV